MKVFLALGLLITLISQISEAASCTFTKNYGRTHEPAALMVEQPISSVSPEIRTYSTTIDGIQATAEAVNDATSPNDGKVFNLYITDSNKRVTVHSTNSETTYDPNIVLEYDLLNPTNFGQFTLQYYIQCKN